MRKITIDDVEWTLTAEPEDMPILGNCQASGDDAEDRAAAESIWEDLENGNEWAWCTAKVTGRCHGLEETGYLGGCSYAGAEDFKAGGYWDDMRSEILDRLNEQAAELVEALCE